MVSRTLRCVMALLVAAAATVTCLGTSSSSTAHAAGVTRAVETTHASGNGPGTRVRTHGCAPYAMCIYPRGTGWNHDLPMITKSFPDHAPAPHDWYSNLQAHYWFNLSGMYGKYKVFNNGLYLNLPSKYLALSEYVSINRGYNGGSGGNGPSYDLGSGRSVDMDLTPYNSITLWYMFYPTTS